MPTPKTRTPSTPRTPRPYFNPQRLIEIYRYMEAYQKQHKVGVSNREMILAGFASSTSVIRYYYGRMEALKMIHQIKVEIDGRIISVSRGLELLPLEQADPLIQNLIQQENQNVTA